jgi:hypothetical protein
MGHDLMVLNDEVGGMWLEGVVIYFKVLFPNVLEDARKTTKKFRQYK